ncbi:Hcp family type VI secretion system effector [Pseudomonas wadenswilerensis]
MSTAAYISIKGKTQGHITKDAYTADSVGNIFREGHEDEILVQEIEHLITAPTDPKNGKPTGERVHQPFTFTCALNKASPMLYQALTHGEELPEVKVRWYRTSSSGHQEFFFTTYFEDAAIVSINTVLPHVENADNASYTQLITVAISYRKIGWVHNICGTEGSDDWRKPNEA